MLHETPRAQVGAVDRPTIAQRNAIQLILSTGLRTVAHQIGGQSGERNYVSVIRAFAVVEDAVAIEIFGIHVAVRTRAVGARITEGRSIRAVTCTILRIQTGCVLLRTPRLTVGQP